MGGEINIFTYVILPAVIAFTFGELVGLLNYILTREALKRGGESKLLYVMPLRMAITAAFLFILYLIGKRIAVDETTYALFIGGVVGLTVALIVFTLMLMKKQKKADNKDDSEGKE